MGNSGSQEVGPHGDVRLAADQIKYIDAAKYEAVVAGSTGASGRALVAALSKRGNCTKIHALVRQGRTQGVSTMHEIPREDVLRLWCYVVPGDLF